MTTLIIGVIAFLLGIAATLLFKRKTHKPIVGADIKNDIQEVLDEKVDDNIDDIINDITGDSRR